MFDFLSLHFAEQPVAEDQVRRFSVCTHFPKVELTNMTLSVEAVVSFFCVR